MMDIYTNIWLNLGWLEIQMDGFFIWKFICNFGLQLKNVNICSSQGAIWTNKPNFVKLFDKLGMNGWWVCTSLKGIISNLDEWLKLDIIYNGVALKKGSPGLSRNKSDGLGTRAHLDQGEDVARYLVKLLTQVVLSGYTYLPGQSSTLMTFSIRMFCSLE